MSICYNCKRCGILKTKHLNDFKKHLNRKNPCKKTNDVMFLSDDQLLVLSLIPYTNDKSNILLDETIHLKKSNLLEKNKKELFDEIENIDINSKSKCCSLCNQDFTNILDLKKHLILNCFYNKIKKNEEENMKNINNININSNNINSNNTNSNNITNNVININLEIKNPIPFDNDWDISKIDEKTKNSLIISKVMYTSLLEEILKNEINLNVIIDKDKDSGMVYKNDIDKYIQMKSKDIVENTMEKLNLHLNEINKENKISFNEVINFSRQMINKKLNDYKKSETIQKNVEELICSIFNTKKDEASDIALSVMNNSEKMNGF